MSQSERLLYINRRIRDYGGVTSAEVARYFEVSQRQVKRDIEYLRERWGAPIVYRQDRKRYEYDQPWDKFDFADEKSLLAVAFVESILNAYNYVPIVSEELITQLKERISGPYQSIIAKVRYELPDMEQIRDEVTYAFCQALVAGSALDISYVSSQGTESQRTIVPLRLINYGGKWYSLAWDCGKKELRTFAMGRIQSVQRNRDIPNQEIPADSEIEAFLNSSYGIFKGAAQERVKLRFYGGAARAVRHQIWHPDQILTEVLSVDEPSQPEGPVVDLSLPVRDWPELLGRALRCGRFCEVLEPPSFRQRWQEELRAMLTLAERST
ncbi:YafY family protein [Gracilinema caldarium]|uniref:helix-turn-helix transcriptional regulator n=1 Tax=Gracilinema caldarium TaxID=215591 RepID=UPI0026EA445F|nr:WYL domain-containing transcriptional regulator [Gracilinema caldarium]